LAICLGLAQLFFRFILSKDLHHFLAAVLPGQVKGRHAFRVFERGIGTTQQQSADHRCLAAQNRQVQWSRVCISGTLECRRGIRISAMLQKDRRCVRVPLLRGRVQGRNSLAVRQANIRSMGDQNPRAFRGAAPRRAVQRCRKGVTDARIRVGAVPQQYLQAFRLPHGSRRIKRVAIVRDAIRICAMFQQHEYGTLKTVHCRADKRRVTTDLAVYHVWTSAERDSQLIQIAHLAGFDVHLFIMVGSQVANEPQENSDTQ